MNAKPIAWALVTGTAAVIAVGFFVPELGLAVASVALGGSAIVASLFARRSVAKHSEIEKMEARLETA